MRGKFDAVSEEVVMVTIYHSMCRGSLPDVRGESVQIHATFIG